MNFNTYGTHYAEFHESTVSAARDNILVFDFGTSPYETWFVSRLYPPETIWIDSQKPLLLALKTYFKSDVPASVVCNGRYRWTVCLGSDRIVFPVGREVQKTALRLYATPYYVQSVEQVTQYLHGTLRPAYDTVFFYKNTILFLDNVDLPYPGGHYFEPCEPTPFHRLCFLSDAPDPETVFRVAEEWRLRRDVLVLPFLTREVRADPKFIDFQPVAEPSFGEVVSTGPIQKTLSTLKPEHLLQDILKAYHKHVMRQESSSSSSSHLRNVGVVIEWPWVLTFEGARSNDPKEGTPRKCVALSVNGTLPSRVLCVHRPYDRYVEYRTVPATIWTPVGYEPSTLPLADTTVRKVAIDTVIVGVVYRNAFFCLQQPLLEGHPTKVPLLNATHVLSPVTFALKEDPNVRPIEGFRLNAQYALWRVSLKGLKSLDVYCLTEGKATDPYPKAIPLPNLVRQWTEFVMEVEAQKEVAGGVDASKMSFVRLALMLSKHNVCFQLNVVEQQAKETIELSENEVIFNLKEEVVKFINDARMVKNEVEVEKRCIIM